MGFIIALQISRKNLLAHKHFLGFIIVLGADWKLQALLFIAHSAVKPMALTQPASRFCSSPQEAFAGDGKLECVSK